eukprot:TRINITY_DN14585_c0_g1_i1.p1 TRINITY_DN14585_c0_g1~~TRINITY_DN14585_c0_g1_i1.p1  ORF type:complete len:1194 (-),score=215.92 TRINITY_DN14585_c0_g1_i1:493-4029(-)
MLTFLDQVNELFAGLRTAMSNVLQGADESALVESLDSLVLSAQGTMLHAIGRYGGWEPQCTINLETGVWEEAITQVTRLPTFLQRAQKDFLLAMSGLPITWNAQARAAHEEQMDLVLGDSQTSLVVEALAAFKLAWSDYASTDAERSAGLQEQYITQNHYPMGSKELFDVAQGEQQYHAVHKQHHPSLREKMTERNYADVFFFDLQGNVVYSCRKASDYGANFAADGEGTWRDSGLGVAYRAALANEGQIASSQWTAYGPGSGELASFLAITVKNAQGVVIGVFATRVPSTAQPVTADANLVAATGAIDSLLMKLKFGDNAGGIPAPPSQPIADQLFKIADEWKPLKGTLEGIQTAANLKVIVDSNDGFMALAQKVQQPYVQGAFGASKTIQGTKIALSAMQQTLVERMMKAALLMNLQDPHATTETLKTDIKAFEDNHELLLLGNMPEEEGSGRSRRLGELSAVGDIPASTEQGIVTGLQEVETSFASFKEALLLVAEGGDTGEVAMRAVIDRGEEVASKQSDAADYYSTLTRTTTRVAIDILTPLPFSGSWTGGFTMRLSTLLAQGLINEGQQILPGYRINSVFMDDTCDSQESVRIVLNELATSDTYVALGGSGCSAVCKGTSFVATSMRLPYVSYDCPDHALSDTREYPGLLRLGTVTTPKTAGIDALAKVYDLSHITIVSDDPSIHREEATLLQTQLAELGYMTEYVFGYDSDWEGMKSIMETLRMSKRRVMFVMGTESFFRKVICGSIVVGARNGIMFLSEGSWRHEWWNQKDPVMAHHENGCAVDARTSMVKDAFFEFKAAWDSYAPTNAQRLEGLQREYIFDNPHELGAKDNLDFAPGDEAYHAAHKKHHPGLRAVLYEKDYYDVFILDLTGNVIYTVYKELDYATNIQKGEWKESGLGDAFRAALANPDEVSLIPWAPYGPSYGALASFFGTGIKDEDGQLVGVYVTQLPPSAMSAADCTQQEIADAYEGAINFASLGQPLDEDMDKPLTCFPGQTARSFLQLLDEHLATGYPTGDSTTKVAAPYQSIKAQAADGVCVFAYTIQHLMNEGYTIEQVRRPDAALYDKFLQFMKTEVDFVGATGRVKFSGNDKPSTLAIQQVREGSYVVAGTIDWNSTIDLALAGISNESWQPPHPDPAPPPTDFPYLLFQVGIPLVCIFCPAVAGCLRSM